jgi:foldase protein PrsA
MLNVKKKILPICITAAAACVIALAGCANNSGMTGGVAATVNGTTISEDQITEYVAQLRKQQGVEEESAWGEFLVSSQLTPKTLRSGVIDQFVNQELVKQAIKEQNVTVPAEDIDAYIAQITEQQGGEEDGRAKKVFRIVCHRFVVHIV